MSEQYIDLGLDAAPVRDQDSIELELDLPSVSAVISGDIKLPKTQYGVLSDDAVESALSRQLSDCLSEFGIHGLSADELFQAGIEELNRSVLHTCRAGFAFWGAQETLKNGDYAAAESNGIETFKGWIESSGLIEQRVYEAIRIAKFFSRLAPPKRTQMLKLGKKPVLLLAKMPQEVIDRVDENGTDILDEAETMTYDQLRDLLKTAERRNQNLNAEVENRDAVIAKLKQRDNRDYVFLPQTHIVREECLAYQAECEVALNSLQAVFNGELFAKQITERDLRIEQIYITANVIAARAAALIERIREKSMIDLPETIASKHMLTDDEAEHWLLDYPLIERKHEAAKAKREDARPKGPGRPKKGQ